MKRIISVLLALCCILTVSGLTLVPSYAEEAADPTVVVTPAEGEDPEIPDEPETPDEPPVDENPIVATLYICVRIRFLGHSWIYVENRTDSELTVGCYTCPVGEGVSIGTECFSKAQGPGIYYNTEAYMATDKDREKTAFMRMDITREQLDTVNKKILETNEWTPFTNCCLFSCKVWNSVSDRHAAYGVFPFITLWSMKRDSGRLEMTRVEKSQVFRQRGRKDNARLEPIVDASLIVGIG